MSEDRLRRIEANANMLDQRITMLAKGVTEVEARLEALEGERESEPTRLGYCGDCGMEIHTGDLFIFGWRVRGSETVHVMRHAECPEPAMSTDEAERIADATMQDVSPEPGEPKVVGYVSDLQLEAEYRTGNITRVRTDHFKHPVIPLSDHEAVMRGLRERLDTVMAQNKRLAERWSNAQGSEQEAWEGFTRLKAENERLETDVERLRMGRDTYREAAKTAMRERDAYADPGNWDGVYVDGTGFVATYVGPTPSDSTDNGDSDGRSNRADPAGDRHSPPARHDDPRGGREHPAAVGTPSDSTEAGEWRPMDSAPRDGTPILVRPKQDGSEFVARWDTSYSIHGLGGHWSAGDHMGQYGDLHLGGWKPAPDDTEHTEANEMSVEGEISRDEMGQRRVYREGHLPFHWNVGDTVRITRIPTPGGDE